MLATRIGVIQHFLYLFIFFNTNNKKIKIWFRFFRTFQNSQSVNPVFGKLSIIKIFV